jgi:putative aldouronate transport system substrate-binding protein
MALLMVTALILASCSDPSGGTTPGPTGTPAVTGPTSPAATPTPAPATYGDTSYYEPFGDTVVVTAWRSYVPSPQIPDVTSYEDQVLWKTVEEKFNVDVQWNHASITLPLMIASGEVSDVLFSVTPADAARYGYQDAFIPLNDLIDRLMPNLQHWFDELPEVKALVMALDGNIYSFPRILLGPETQLFQGWFANYGKLGEAGLSADGLDTAAGVYETLLAYKQDHPDSYPIAAAAGLPFYIFNWFGASYGITTGASSFFAVNYDGEPIFTPATDEYRQAVEYMAQMYADGILHPEFNNLNANSVIELIVSGNTVLSYGSHVGYLVRCLNLMEAAGQPETLASIPTPANDSTGERWNTGNHAYIDAGHAAVITAWADEDAQTAVCKILNWLFDQNNGGGYEVMCHGIEGVHWVKGDDYQPGMSGYVITEAVTGSPYFVDYANYFNNIIGNFANMPTAYGRAVMVNLYTRQEGLDALLNIAPTGWQNTKMPPVLHSQVDSEAISIITSDLNTLIMENTTNWIKGINELNDETWAEFQQAMVRMNSETYVDIMVNSYRRFQSVVAESN